MINYDLRKIKSVIFDVDGVLSTNTIPIDNEGNPGQVASKTFTSSRTTPDASLKVVSAVLNPQTNAYYVSGSLNLEGNAVAYRVLSAPTSQAKDFELSITELLGDEHNKAYWTEYEVNGLGSQPFSCYISMPGET